MSLENAQLQLSNLSDNLRSWCQTASKYCHRDIKKTLKIDLYTISQMRIYQGEASLSINHIALIQDLDTQKSNR